MRSSKKTFLEKYPARDFGEVLGRDAALRRCQDLVLSGRGGGVILHGQTGIGKTMIARILADAILCEHPTESGSRCGRCQSCETPRQRHPDYVEKSVRHADQVEAALERFRYGPVLRNRSVVILDEAQLLSRTAWDAMLSHVDEYSWLILVLVTPALEKIPAAMVSRCVVVELRPVDFATCLGHLKKICDRESIKAEPEALALIAAQSDGNVRDLVQLLDRGAQDNGPITKERVRRLLNLDYVDTLARYMRAAFDRNLDAQLREIEGWTSPPDKKAAGIYQFVLSLLERELGLYRSHSVMNLVAREDWGWILEQGRATASAADVLPREFWENVVKFWKPEHRTTDDQLRAKLIEFDTLLNLLRRPALQQGSKTPSPGLYPPRVRYREPRRPRSNNGPSKRPPSPDQPYLSLVQVGELWDAVSFMTQERGCLLNAHILIAHERLGISVAKDASNLASALLHELGQTLKRWDEKSGGFHWAYVHERGERLGFTTRVAAYIPEDLADLVEDWLERFLMRRFDRVDRLYLRSAVRMTTRHFDSSERRIRRHHNLLRCLCRAVDPAIEVFHHGERRALIDVLKIPQRIREPFRPMQINQRWRISETVGVGARESARRDGLAPLSAFADGAWDWLRTGWEIDEHRDRERERSERAEAEAVVKLRFSDGAGSLEERALAAELDRLRASWPVDPHERERSWVGWLAKGGRK